jgi:hypothetical protein
MSAKKKYVSNVCTFTTVNNAVNNSGSWTLQGGYPLQPDEIIIRQITYNSNGASKDNLLFLISSNLSNSIIGSVCNISGFTSNPGTIITPGPLPQVITFQLQTPTSVPTPISPDTLDMIAIHMDFINYR